MKKKSSLFGVLITLSIVPLILSVVIISIISLTITKNNLEEKSRDTLFIVANNLASYCRENEINAINAADYYDYLDNLKEQNIEMAIIIDGAPCATSIKNENDYRIREIEFEKDMIADIAEIEEGYFDSNVVIDNKIYSAYYVPIKANNEIIGMAFAGELQSNITGATKSIVISFCVISSLLIVIFAMITLLFSRGLIKSFQAVGVHVNALSKGDLTKQNEHKSFVREMDTLLGETRLMQNNLSETIGKVKNVAQNLAAIVAQVTEMSDSSSGRALHITSSMEELSLATVGMAENVQDMNAQMLEIGNCVNDISDRIIQLNRNSETILQTNFEAKTSMDTIMENSKQSVDAVKEIELQIKETNDSIKEVDQAVELILSISQQTNLLSLNASIEAARAGAFGKGFAVVAEEIRHLSEQSAEGAEIIKNLAGTITEKSEKSVRLAQKVHSLIFLEQENISDTQKKYETLSNNINQSVNDIEMIAEMTEHLNQYKEKVIDNVQNLSAISEENTASNQEVSANVSEIVAEVQTVNISCERMNGLACELQESVSYFQNREIDV